MKTNNKKGQVRETPRKRRVASFSRNKLSPPNCSYKKAGLQGACIKLRRPAPSATELEKRIREIVIIVGLATTGSSRRIIPNQLRREHENEAARGRLFGREKLAGCDDFIGVIRASQNLG